MSEKEGQLADILRNILAVMKEQSAINREAYKALAEMVTDVIKTFDKNQHTFYQSAEQRFNAMHLEHDLILRKLAGDNDEGPQ